jgi:hypothetical protein
VPRRFGIDHNFPENLLAAVSDLLPFDGKLISHISPALVKADTDDWRVLLALTQLGYNGMITLDFNMLLQDRSMAVVHQTKCMLIAVQDGAQDPLRASGEVLAHARHIVMARNEGTGQVVRIIKRRLPPPETGWSNLGKFAKDAGISHQQAYDGAKLSEQELLTTVLSESEHRKALKGL